MTAENVAEQIVDRIDSGFSSGLVTTETPETAWASWFNNFGFLIIVVFKGVNITILSRDEFDDMVPVFDSRFSLRASWVQQVGVYMVETMYTENDGNDALQIQELTAETDDDIRR